MRFKNPSRPINAGDVGLAIEAVSTQVLQDLRTTVATLTLDNGFTVTGAAACGVFTPFDRDIGAKLAIEAAKEKVYELLAFASHEQAFQAAKAKHAEERASALKRMQERDEAEQEQRRRMVDRLTRQTEAKAEAYQSSHPAKAEELRQDEPAGKAMPAQEPSISPEVRAKQRLTAAFEDAIEGLTKEQYDTLPDTVIFHVARE